MDNCATIGKMVLNPVMSRKKSRAEHKREPIPPKQKRSYVPTIPSPKTQEPKTKSNAGMLASKTHIQEQRSLSF
ncbi:hypothetical protein P153DRAFT_362721 [Dothidotthia symphoricarpi CBS 119687]|uniref:Uncharacterized protein n=1 Tax=Dothidotthia symphoricarpi CBS 119687 TaxID=1392245 RepID=A0A6A6AST5_9PLEO|nr:uncharacterized protein P153DRAFT_362721 [Dothidotthia symphoricarpi CBS 119687]KAF2135019.1 hypothetical protein P153DRAFT_362721 [Dothidotthia symphoricarpi CBS 119687]